MRVLAVNSGSSSLKFALYDMGPAEDRVFSGTVSGIGLGRSYFRVQDGNEGVLEERPVAPAEPRDAAETLLAWLRASQHAGDFSAVGYRMVHGGPRYRQPQLATPELMQALSMFGPIDPEHLPQAIEVVQAMRGSYPTVKHVVCFDTAFHRNMPAVAQMVALPQSLHDEGVIRYGFHGLSYEYVAEKLNGDASGGRTIIAHLGNGASMAAVRDGQSVETTMGFSPTGGLVMSTRCGDLDPAVVLYLLRHKGMSPAEINRMLNQQAGLLGVSGLSADMRELLEREKAGPAAALAVDLFCYQARKFVGALAAVLGGLDRLVFTGGIGENAPQIRQRICRDLQFLGVELDPDRNQAGAPIVSRDGRPVIVQIVKTNEELMIARHVVRLLG